MSDGAGPKRLLGKHDLTRLRESLRCQGATTTQIAAVIAADQGLNMRVAFRLALGLTQDGVADLYNRHWPSRYPKTGKNISYWERWQGPESSQGGRAPTCTDLARLAALYKCLVDDLLTPAPATTDAMSMIAAPAASIQDATDEGDATNRRDALRVGLLSTTAPWLHQHETTLAMATGDSGRVTGAVVTLIAETVTRTQQLDDQQGGGARGYVADQFNAVAQILRRDRYDPATGRQLSALLAQLAQTAGFMAYDAGDDIMATACYRTGLDAARAARDRPLSSSILSLMSNQAATCGRTDHALQLAHHAQQTAAGAPALVRALTAARSGLAHAAAGDLPGFQRTRDQVLTMLNRAATDSESVPLWAYYVNRTELDAIAGRSLVTLARRLPRHHKRLLTQAEDLLRGRALNDEPAFERSALRHSAWLALAHTQCRELDQAVTAGYRALDRLPSVTSARSIQLLRVLRSDLAAHRTEPAVRDLTTALDRQLSLRDRYEGHDGAVSGRDGLQ